MTLGKTDDVGTDQWPNGKTFRGLVLRH
jgi:hypothetical protein